MEDWSSTLVEAGHRMTRSRRAIIEALQRADRPLVPAEVLSLSRQSAPRVDLATVYRTLDLLAEMRLVRRVHQEEGCHAYLAAHQGHHHAIICQSCGRACEFRGSDELSSLLRRVERETGYVVREHLLQLSGLCPRCAAAEKSTMRSRDD